MLAWWPRKSKPKSEPEPASSPNPKQWRPSHKEKEKEKAKASSFDEGLARKGKFVDRSGPFTFGHRLPKPVSSPLPFITQDVAVAGPSPGSESASSASSLGCDESPELEFCRYADPIIIPMGRNSTDGIQTHHHVAEYKHQFMVNTVFEHPRCADISTSPRKELHLLNLEASTHYQSFNTANCTRGHPLPTSPKHPRAHRVCPGSPKQRQDDLKSSPQPLPLPLPPISHGSSSSSSHYLPSEWIKGKLLGRGTFGQVYHGFNSEGGHMGAIKEVQVISDDSNSKECLRQLNQEITLLSQLSHPNIVRYYGSELVDDTLSVYLEYMSGGSIHKLLQEYGPFREPVIRSYTRQILSGLAYLHGRSTVHRDIKGANILVGPNGEVKLADFGLAKHIAAYTSIRSFKGSPYWMAPEVVMNRNGYNLSVDIWSLGCTIIEMATSKPPWSSEYGGIQAIFKIGNSKDIPDIPNHLSSDAKSFLKLCLRRDPAARPTAAQLMDCPFVQDQPLIKTTKSSMFRDMLPPVSAGSQRMASMDLSPNRSISPVCDRDYGIGHFVDIPSSSRNPSNMHGARTNLSLPVSPCSSPLRRYKQSNRSCLPSPPHPANSTGAINFSRTGHSLYSSRNPSNIFDLWPDISQKKAQSPYGSPRRR